MESIIRPINIECKLGSHSKCDGNGNMNHDRMVAAKFIPCECNCHERFNKKEAE